MIIVQDASGAGLKFVNVRVAHLGEPTEKAVDDRFTDLVGHTAWPGGFVGGDRWSSATLYVNDRNVLTTYKSASVDVANFAAINESANLVVTLERAGAACPPGHDKEAWHVYFRQTCQRFGFALVSEDALAAMNPTMKACDAFFQYTSDTPPKLRPRLFLPNPNGDPFAYAVDLGDWGKPWTWEPRF